MPTDLLLRPATVADAPAMADLHVDSRLANIGSMPPMVHPRDAAHRWMRGRLEGDSTGWVAERDGRAVGYLVLTGNWLDDLFLGPGETGHGVGAALIDVAKAERPEGFCLWVFETNLGARRFYGRHGLVELERTDGSTNAERAPDVRMVWPGREPLVFLRSLIDEVDDQLGDLLARRVALTRVVQTYKPDRTRDPEREREIVARLAGSVPELGEDRLARIMHVIISESLDASP
ncbi:GNAT family N-acetyltransferase [Nocardioides euryhalodurans]|uniref:GNAT family N-acetyltransferase n=1 Tax=Nocardioides euryhalodurans TaxID=2518370 RepID=A0A4V1BDE7_9ACTN|nr:GNAT family N-acetyltransferase [Nocardioides euryhalodurans]QBR90862.1 GNAT family N-acetyltransferase [Nocardioides euryhalodurans]